MNDNLISAADGFRTSILNLKKKSTAVRISMEQFNMEIERLELKLNKFISETEIFKERVKKEYNRELKKKEDELAVLRRHIRRHSHSDSMFISADHFEEPEEDDSLKIAKTVMILNTFISSISGINDDFKMLSQAVIYKCVYCNLMGDLEKYRIANVPDDVHEIVELGKVSAKALEEKFPYHVNSEEMWAEEMEIVEGAWKNDLLPAIYQYKEIQFPETPLSYTEMMSWINNPSHRMEKFPEIEDAYRYFNHHLMEVNDLVDAFD